MTGRDLVTASLRLIGAIAPGEAIAAGEATDGLASINRMIDSWSNEDLLIYNTVTETFSLVAGTASYTIGTSGVFNTTRPQSVLNASLKIGTIEYPLSIVGENEWAQIPQKTQSSVPAKMFVDGGYPLTTISLYPVPAGAYSLVLYSLKALTTITSLDTVLSLPPGYEEALVYNAAIRLSPEYGRPVSQEIAMVAGESKSLLKRKNHEPGVLKSDPAMTGRSQFDIRTGDYR